MTTDPTDSTEENHSGMWNGLPQRLSIDRYAASRATLVSFAVAVLVVLAQGAVSAAVTGGTQPMAVTNEVPASSDAQAWQQAPSRTVSLSEQQMAIPYGGGSTEKLHVKAITNRTHTAFKLRWNDTTPDTSIARPRGYSDAAAIMLKSGTQPPITMGATGTPVNIWYWRASWQFSNHTGSGAMTGDMYAYPHPTNATKPGQAVGNPLSKDHYRQYAQNYYAKGYGSLSHAPAQNVHAQGERTPKGWEVVLIRQRSTNGTYDATFNNSKKMYLAFAVWNGSASEVNGQKSITMQFSTLDTKSGALSDASSQDSGSDDGDSETASAGNASNSMDPFWNQFGAVFAAVIVAWLIAYRGIESG